MLYISAVHNLKDISHDNETNLMSDNTLFFSLSISLLLWKDTLNTDASVDLVALLF